MDWLTGENIGTLMMLIFLQAVLGFDNLLYISIESKRVAEDKREMVQRVGIIMAIALRLILLVVIIEAIKGLQTPLFEIHWSGVIEAARHCTPGADGKEICTGGVSGHGLIVLAGGAFILYTAVKEIMHMLSLKNTNHAKGEKTRSPQKAIFWIVIMNLVFSFDSILGAIALTDQFWIMAVAIIISGILMVALAGKVSAFLQKNRMYEVLGLFILFLVGVMLVSEGGHLVGLKLAGEEIHAMSKATFYFVLIVLVIVDVAQGRYQKKLNTEIQRDSEENAAKS
jgi:predicted tellurium resistance membrane protein TerC